MQENSVSYSNTNFKSLLMQNRKYRGTKNISSIDYNNSPVQISETGGAIIVVK
jgi:hypothetical protein